MLPVGFGAATTVARPSGSLYSNKKAQLLCYKNIYNFNVITIKYKTVTNIPYLNIGNIYLYSLFKNKYNTQL